LIHGTSKVRHASSKHGKGVQARSEEPEIVLYISQNAKNSSRHRVSCVLCTHLGPWADRIENNYTITRRNCRLHATQERVPNRLDRQVPIQIPKITAPKRVEIYAKMVKAKVGIDGLHLLEDEKYVRQKLQAIHFSKREDKLTGVIAVGSEGLGTHQGIGVPGTSIGPLATCVADPCDPGNGVAD